MLFVAFVLRFWNTSNANSAGWIYCSHAGLGLSKGVEWPTIPAECICCIEGLDFESFYEGESISYVAVTSIHRMDMLQNIAV